MPDPNAGATGKTTTTTRSDTKVKVQGYISAPLADAARDAISALGSHIDDPRTLSELMEHALRHELARLVDKRNGGRPFPPRPRRNLPTGPRGD